MSEHSCRIANCKFLISFSLKIHAMTWKISIYQYPYRQRFGWHIQPQSVTMTAYWIPVFIGCKDGRHYDSLLRKVKGYKTTARGPPVTLFKHEHSSGKKIWIQFRLLTIMKTPTSKSWLIYIFFPPEYEKRFLVCRLPVRLYACAISQRLNARRSTRGLIRHRSLLDKYSILKHGALQGSK